MPAQALARKKFALYSDEVFTSTDLNRRSGEVLNRARKNPVTIARNNEQFALMRRDEAAYLISTLDKVKDVLDLIQGATSVAAGIPVVPAHSWIKALSTADRFSMVEEVLKACLCASTAEDWDALPDIIYEWKETALVTESRVIQDTLSEGSQEAPLGAPSLEEGGQLCDPAVPARR